MSAGRTCEYTCLLVTKIAEKERSDGLDVFLVFFSSCPSQPELRNVRNSNRELLGQIKALAKEPRSDVLTEANVREKEGVVVSLRAAYNNWRGRGLAREKHIEKLKAEWEVYSSANAIAASTTEFFSADVDASVTLRGVPSLGDVMSTLDVSSGGAVPGAGKSLEKMNPVELRAALEEAAHRLQSMELSLASAKQTEATLDHMVKRFTVERMGEEAKYVEIKRSVEAILRQEKEHVLQVKIVGHDEDVARSKIGALQEKLSRVAAKRRDLVTEERGKMSTKAELEDYVKNRGEGRKTIVENMAGDLTREQEEALSASANVTNARQAMSAMEALHADKLERAFTVIAERTGDDDINSFVNRFLALVEIGKHADSGKEATEERAAELRRALDTLRNQLTEIQDEGVSITIRRNEFNDLEAELNEKQKIAAHFNASSDALNHRLSHLKFGVTAFSAKLELVAPKLLPDNKPPSRAPSSRGDPTVRQLHFIDSCIERMVAALDAEPGGSTQKSKQINQNNHRTDEDDDSSAEDDVDLGALRAEFEYNVRVNEGDPSLTVDGDPLFGDFEGGGYPPDDDDDVQGIVPLDEGHKSVAGLAREAKSAVMKYQRQEERRRLRQAEEVTRGKSSKTVRSSSTAHDGGKKQPRESNNKKGTSSGSKRGGNNR